MNALLVPLVLLTLAQALGMIAYQTVPTMASEAEADFGIDAAVIGYFGSLVYTGAMGATLLCGGFIRRYGTIRVCQVCLLSCAAGVMLSLTASVPLAALGAVMIGMGYGPLTPASSHTLARLSPTHLRGRVFSIKQTGVPLGAAVVGVTVPALVVLGGWRLAALAAGLICILSVIAMQAFRASVDVDREPGHRLFRGWRDLIVGPLALVMGEPGLRNLCISSFCFAALQLILFTFLVVYLDKEVGLSLAVAGGCLSVAQVFGIAGRVFWGWVGDRFIEPRLLLAGLGFAMAGLMAAFGFIGPDWPLLLVQAICAGLGATAIAWNGVFLAEIARLSPPGEVSRATGGVLLLTFAGIVVGPSSFSLILQATGHYLTGFLSVAALAALAATLMLLGGGGRMARTTEAETDL